MKKPGMISRLFCLYRLLQPQRLFRQRQGFFNGSAFIPQDDPEAGMQEGIVDFRRVDPRKTAAEVFHGCGWIRFLLSGRSKKRLTEIAGSASMIST